MYWSEILILNADAANCCKKKKKKAGGPSLCSAQACVSLLKLSNGGGGMVDKTGGIMWVLIRDAGSRVPLSSGFPMHTHKKGGVPRECSAWPRVSLLELSNEGGEGGRHYMEDSCEWWTKLLIPACRRIGQKQRINKKTQKISEKTEELT